MTSFTQTIHASANGVSLIESADYAAMRGLLDLEVGTDVQAYDAELAAIAGLAVTDGNIIVGNGTTWVAESGATARTSLGCGTIATQAANSVAITGGTINGTTVGATTAAAGKFSSVTTTSIASATTLALTTTDGAVSITAAGVGQYLNLASSASYVRLVAGPNQIINIDCGGLFTFRDRDDSYATRLTINSANGELAIPSNTVGLKLDSGGTTTLISDGMTVAINKALTIGGDLNANGGTLHFGTAENVQTPAAGNSNTVTIDLGAENHHTLDCATSASGAVTANLTVPPGPCGGTIIVKLGSVDITWTPSAGTARWLGTERTWDTVGDDGKWCVVSWRWDATNLFLSSTDATA